MSLKVVLLAKACCRSEALARTKKVRAGHRSSATRLIHQLEGEYEIEDGPMLDRLVQCKVSLNEKLDKLHELDDQILALVEDEDIESEIEQANQFNKRIHKRRFVLEHKISARESSTVLPPSSHSVSTTVLPDTVTVSSSEAPVTSSHGVLTTPHVTTPAAHHTTTAVSDTSTTTVTSVTVTPVTHHAVTEPSSSKVKFPKLEPKKFNGDLTKWETFWSSFESSIHSNPALTTVDKFQYLISLLKEQLWLD